MQGNMTMFPIATMVLLLVVASASFVGSARADDRSTGRALKQFACKTVKCGRACCKPPAYSTAFCSSGKCAWRCKAGYIPCNGKCYLAAPIKNSVGWCQDSKTYQWACASFHTLCRAACVPYPSGAVNIVCDQLRGTITYQCGMNWVNCFNKYCCEPPLNAVPLCLVDAQLQPLCGFVCTADYKKCNNSKACCKK